VQGSEIRGYAAQFLFVDPLELKAFGRGQDPNLCVGRSGIKKTVRRSS